MAPSAATVGDIQKQGAIKLGRPEVVALYSGATVSGAQVGRPNTRFRLAFKKDGSATGSYSGPGGQGTVNGIWTVNDAGQICIDFVNSNAGKVQGCNVVFSQGGRFYDARTDAVADVVYEREITK